MYLVRRRDYGQLLLFGGLLFVMLASTVAGFVSWRYRLPNTVPLMVLAGYGVLHLGDVARRVIDRKEPPRTVMIFACTSVLLPLVVCAALAYHPVPRDLKARFYDRAAQNDRASSEAEKMLAHLGALEAAPSGTAQAKAQRAYLLHRLHRHTESFRLLEELHAQGFYLPLTTQPFITYLLWLGDFDRAAGVVKTLARKRPAYVPMVENLLTGIEKQAYEMFVAPRAGKTVAGGR